MFPPKGLCDQLMLSIPPSALHGGWPQMGRWLVPFICRAKAYRQSRCCIRPGRRCLPRSSRHAKNTAFVPSAMVERNAWGSKARFVLAAAFEPKALSSVWSVASIGVWRVIFLLRGEPLGWPAGDIDTSFCLTNVSVFILVAVLGQSKSERRHLAMRFFGWIQFTQGMDRAGL